MNDDRTASLKLLGADIRRRFAAPIRSVTFWTDLIFAVLAGGGLGIWNTLYQVKLAGQWDMIAITSALYTYFPAIVAAALLQTTHEEQPYWRSFGLLAATGFAVLFFLAATTSARFWFAFAGTVLAVAFWWLANGEKNCYKDINPKAPTPEPTEPLSGDVSNWSN